MTKFENDSAIVENILNKPEITKADRIMLLSVYQTPYHDSGKIETLFSCDSSCNHCTFCKTVRENMKNNPLCICNYCYDDAQEKRYPATFNRHGLQLKIMSSVQFEREELAMLPIFGTCRFNSSGDIENIIHAMNYINIAYSHPLVRFTLFAKNTAPVVAAIDKLGKPENLLLVQSSLIMGKPCKLAKYFDYTFTVYVTEEEVKLAIAHGAVECNGQKCKDCGFKCYNGTLPNGSNIAELARFISKAKKKEIEEYKKSGKG